MGLIQAFNRFLAGLNFGKASPAKVRLFRYMPIIWVAVIGVALFQLAIIPHVDTYNTKRVIQFACLGVGLLSLLFSKKCSCSNEVNASSIYKIKGGRLYSACLLLGAGVVGSIINAKFPVWALLDFEYLILSLGMVWFVSLCFHGASLLIWKWFGILVIATMLLFSLRSSFEVLLAAPFSNKLTVTPGFANIRNYANVAVVLVPLSLLALINRASIYLRLLAWVVGIFWLWVLVITEARSGILSLGLAAIAVAIFCGKEGRKCLSRFAWMSFICTLLYLIFPVQKTAGWTKDIASSSGRIELWYDAWIYFIDSFPFGIGGMMFAASGNISSASPHNLMLTLMAEWGFLALLGIAIFSWLLFLISDNRKPQDIMMHVRVPILWGLLAGLLNLQFAGAHIDPFGSITLALAAGAYLSFVTVKRSTPGTAGSGYIKPLSVILLCVWGHAGFLGYSLYQFSDKTRASCAEESAGVLYPRIWVQGRLDCGSS